MSTSTQQSRTDDCKQKLAKLFVRPTPPNIPMCYCRATAKVWTSMTTKNPLRRFMKCSRNTCSYYEFIEDDICQAGKDRVNMVLDKCCELYDEVSFLRGRFTASGNTLRIEGSGDSDARDFNLISRNMDLERQVLHLKHEEENVIQREKLRREKAFLLGIVIGFGVAFLFVSFLR